MTQFKHTTAIRKMRAMKRRFRVVQGGTSAGKTFGILPILIDWATKNENKTISVVSESVPHLRKGAMKDFLAIMRMTGRFKESRWSKVLLTYTFYNGTVIEFFSAKDEGRVRGPRRDVLYMNEANNLKFDTFHQLSIRTNDFVYIDYNPSAEFWAHTELVNNPVEQKDVDFLVINYNDNEALSQSIVNDIEKAKDKAFYDPDGDIYDDSNIKNTFWSNWWKVYGLGEIGQLEGVVFNNWKQVDNIPKAARLVGFGVDFGYTNDPTAIVAAWYCDGEYYFDLVAYEVGMKVRNIAAKIKAYHPIAVNKVAYCDSAEPRTIASLREHGISAKKTRKGKDSIKLGIELINQQTTYWTSRSLEAIKELRVYTWAKDRDGKALNEPIDDYNHAMDAWRYWAIMNIKQIGVKKKKGVNRR